MTWLRWQWRKTSSIWPAITSVRQLRATTTTRIENWPWSSKMHSRPYVTKFNKPISISHSAKFCPIFIVPPRRRQFKRQKYRRRQGADAQFGLFFVKINVFYWFALAELKFPSERAVLRLLVRLPSPNCFENKAQHKATKPDFRAIDDTDFRK